MSPLVVVSGLPASGKTTVGRLLSERLAMPLIDKDAILEALFDSVGCNDTTERTRLSRASDEVLYALAATSVTPVLVNWWDRDSAPERLRQIATSVVEVFCECPAHVAAARSTSRVRHPGHRDGHRNASEVKRSFDDLPAAARQPLGLGKVVRIDTGGALAADLLVQHVRSALDAIAPTTT